MRYQGSLIEWNAARGCGFVRRHGDTGGRVFVHVRAFGQRGVQPAVGDVVTYAVERDERGRPRAADVAFAVSRSRNTVRGRSARVAAPRAGLLRGVLVAVAVVALAVFAWTRYASRTPDFLPSRATIAPARTAEGVPAPSAPVFTCSSKQHCRQMTSCAEATFYLRHCPGTLADGDGDGIPCEDQWCSH